MRLSILLWAQADAAIASSLEDLGRIPYVVLAGYLLLLMVLGTFGWLRSKAGEEDYYLAGREQGWLVSSLTIMATFFSSFALLGAPGMVYREGVVFALFSLNVPVAGLCVYLLGCRIWKAGRSFGYVTPGDMIADYYGSRYWLRILVALTGFLYAIPYVVMQIQAGGIISQKLFGEASFTIGAILLAAITMVYIMIGGMRSVAWTDLVQGLLLISGMLVGGLAMFLVFDGPANFAARVGGELPASSLTAPGNTHYWQWTMVFTVCLLGSSGSMVQPAQWMRYYSVRSARTLRRAALIFAAVLTTCFILGVMLIGLAGQLLYPLQRGHIQQLRDAPAKLDTAVPEHLRLHFRYIPPKAGDARAEGNLIWSWSIVSPPRPMSPAELEELQALSDSQSFRSSLRTLRFTLADSTKQPSLMPHWEVDPDPTDGTDYDSILVVVLYKQLPLVLKQFGALFASLMIVAIMAASMSTADSNLHALSAVLTRDVYDQFVRPKAAEVERVWVGRSIIIAATVLSLAIVIMGRQPAIAEKYDVLNMIATMGLMAIAFSAQLLPIAIDILFLRRGTGAGAAVGLAAGLLGAFLFGPLLGMLQDALGSPAWMERMAVGVANIKGLLTVNGVRYGVHGSVWGLLLNVPLFALVSLVTQPVPDRQKARFEAAMR